MILPPEIRDTIFKDLLVTVAWYQPIGGNGVWWRIGGEFQVPPQAIQATYPLTRDNWYYLETKLQSGVRIREASQDIREEITAMLARQNRAPCYVLVRPEHHY